MTVQTENEKPKILFVRSGYNDMGRQWAKIAGMEAGTPMQLVRFDERSLTLKCLEDTMIAGKLRTVGDEVCLSPEVFDALDFSSSS